MFGLKIRSWMENHIVRPRKKGNKNKNGNSGNLVTSINNTQNGHKGISSNQGDSSVVGSPARRSEVSPIQNHTTSRFGWHSPEDDEFCKIDQNLPYLVKTSTYSPKVRPMNSKTINRSNGISYDKQMSNTSTSSAPYSKSVDTKYSLRATFDYNNSKLSPRDNSAVLRAVSASTSANISSFATASRLNKYRYQPAYEANEMFEQQTQPQQHHQHQQQQQQQPDSKQNTFGKYEKNSMCNGIGNVVSNSATSADDGENNQMVVITLNGANGTSAQHKQKIIEINKHATSKKPNFDKMNQQQSAIIQNYHNNHLDYRNGSQMSFYDNQQQYQCADDELHRQHYCSDRQPFQQQQQQQTDGSSDASTKSEQQMSNMYHQQNGYQMNKSKKNLANNNESVLTSTPDDRHRVMVSNVKQKTNQYGKILNCTRIDKLSTKDHRNGSRPIPMLPSPPSTPPPPLNAKIKDYHDSSNKFYQTQMHLSNQQQNRFNGNVNNNNEINSANNNNYNVNGFEYECSHGTATSKSSSSSSSLQKQQQMPPPTLNKQSTNLHGNGCDEITLHNQHKELVQSRTKCKQSQARTNSVYHHSNGIGTTAAITTTATSATHLTPTPSNHQLAHVINSLSSPESAYSTGYSTDGTSPSGTANAPEYYINMRTGTHYFPRGVNGVAAVERSRQKFGLNKIEETVGETMCTTSITNSTSGSAIISNHRRTESCDLGQHQRQSSSSIFKSNNSINSISGNNNGNGVATPILSKEVNSLLQANNTHSQMSPDLQRHLAYQTYRGFESPSPRQRCRIKTNPWLSTPETSTANGNSMVKKMDIDTSSTSSGIKSSSDAGTDDKKGKNHISSESESSSSTEIEISRKSFSPNTIRKRKLDKQLSERLSNRASNGCDSDDEDATFNELMGKFDESYIYEKETDILSDDSDPTECASDLDTGQDGGDECETDELLDIDYIDTGSIQEVTDKEMYKNTGSCTYYHNNQAMEKRQNQLRKSRKQQSEDTSGSRRRKRLTRTRKRNSECRDNSQNSRKTNSPHRFRESRSVGGTPVSLRRNKSDTQYQSTPKMVPLSSRCNSLTFTEIHSIRSRFLAIAESEKALLKADIEADVKYKQLIHEAETILVSMKTTAIRETPVPSPSRRVCNVPANKRVEMLRNCEADLRRELLKTQSKPNNEVTENVINRKDSFEMLAAPSSPVKVNYANGNGGRFSPRKTHLTNFINQNITPVELLRRQNPVDGSSVPSAGAMDGYETKMKRSPCLQFNMCNNRAKMTPPKSPMPRRRFRSQSPRICIDSDSDSDTLNGNPPNTVIQKKNSNSSKRGEINRNKENKLQHSWRKSRQSIVQKDDIINQNTIQTPEVDVLDTVDHRPFRSIDMAHRITESFYCPQSEPLKRKIYSEKTLDRLQKSLDMESEIPKKALLQKISNLRRDRQQQLQSTRTSTSLDHSANQLNGLLSNNSNASESDLAVINKRQLILNTIEDLKRNLEDQSIELIGLNDDEE